MPNYGKNRKIKSVQAKKIFNVNSHDKTAAIEAFGKGAVKNTIGDISNSTLENLNPSEKAKQTFTVPINEYDLTILRLLKDIEDRSQRKIAERLFSKALRELWAKQAI